MKTFIGIAFIVSVFVGSYLINLGAGGLPENIRPHVGFLFVGYHLIVSGFQLVRETKQ